MCGRYALNVPRPRLSELFPHVDFPLTIEPRYNIAPTQEVLAIRPAVLSGDRPTAELMRWGLEVPTAAASRALFNIRSETALRAGIFNHLLRQDRVLIPASHFYEWQGQGRERRPMMIRPRDGVLALAGLLGRWTDPETGTSVPAVTILTCTPNDLMRPIHDRMPVILDADAQRTWLDPGAAIERVAPLLVPCPDGRLEVLPASRLVNDHRNEGPELLVPDAEPADRRGAGEQLRLLDD